MRKITLMLFTLLLSFLGTAQVTVGSETATTTNLPLTSCYGYSYTEQIFLASEINASGDITSISFYLDAATSTADFSNSVGWTIYLGNTTKTDYTSTTDWITSTGLTQVYTGDLTFPAEDNLVTITFDTPFTYNGTDNLVVAIDENTAGWNCSMAWRRSSTANATSIYYRNDSTNPDPTAPPTATGTFSYRANTVFGGIMQACPTPSDLTVANEGTTTADLGWTENGSAALWNIEIGVDGFTPTGTPTVSGVTNPYTAMSLMPATDYQFYVQSDCTGGELSSWAGPFGFTTACPIYTPEYNADMSSNAPDCWEEANSGDSTTGPMDLGAGTWYGSNHNGTPSNAINLWNDVRSDWIISPEFDLSAAAPSELNVYVALTENFASGSGADLGSDDRVELLMTIDGGTTWTAMQSWSQGSVPTDVGEEITYDLSAITGNVQFAFLGSEGTVDDPEDVYFHVSKFQVRETPSCLEPTALTASNMTTTTADLGWTEQGTATLWNVEIVAAGVTPTGTATDTGVSNPFMATGLTSATAYDYYVQADCSGDVSIWVGPFTFSTLCDPITSFPWTEDFESITTPELPICWDENNVNADTDSWATYGTYGVGGSNAAGLYTDFNGGSNDDYLILPQFTLTGGERLKYSVRARSAGEPNDYKVVLSTTGTMPADFSVDLMGLTVVSSTTHAEEIIDLSAYTGDVYIAIHVPDGGLDGWYIYFDDFTVEPLPACVEPSGLMVTNVTETTADISWTAGGSETLWDIELVDITAAGTATGTATATGVSNPYTLMGLTDQNEYEVYVRADCGGATSVWVGPMSFSTLCNSTSVPFSEDFQTGGACGSIVNEGAGNTWQLVTSTSYGFAPNHLRYTYNGANAANSWFFTQGINLTSGEDYMVSYDYGGTGTTFPEKLKVAYGTSPTAAAMTTELADYPNVNNATPNSDSQTFTAPADGVYYFGFQAYSDANQFYLHLDNIAVDVALSTDEFESQSAFTYYPNPVKNTLTLNAQNTIENVTMYNMLGQEVLRATPNAIDSDIDMSSLEAGTYFVQVTIANISKTVRVIKQ